MNTFLKSSAAPVAAIAERFGVTPGRIRQLVRSNDVIGERIGGKLLLVDIDSARRYFATRKIGRPRAL